MAEISFNSVPTRSGSIVAAGEEWNERLATRPRFGRAFVETPLDIRSVLTGVSIGAALVTMLLCLYVLSCGLIPEVCAL